MKFERFTVKAREAIADAQQLAGRLGNPEIRPGHLLAAMLSQEGGVLPSIIRHTGVSVESIEGEVAQIVDGYSKVSGSNKAATSRDFDTVLSTAESEAKKLGDSHISTEIILVAVAMGSSKSGQLLKRYGLTREKLLEAIEVVRGGQKVTSEDPESQYEALAKYTRDM